MRRSEACTQRAVGAEQCKLFDVRRGVRGGRERIPEGLLNPPRATHVRGAPFADGQAATCQVVSAAPGVARVGALDLPGPEEGQRRHRPGAAVGYLPSTELEGPPGTSGELSRHRHQAGRRHDVRRPGRVGTQPQHHRAGRVQERQRVPVPLHPDRVAQRLLEALLLGDVAADVRVRLPPFERHSVAVQPVVGPDSVTGVTAGHRGGAELEPRNPLAALHRRGRLDRPSLDLGRQPPRSGEHHRGRGRRADWHSRHRSWPVHEPDPHPGPGDEQHCGGHGEPTPRRPPDGRPSRRLAARDHLVHVDRKRRPLRGGPAQTVGESLLHLVHHCRPPARRVRNCRVARCTWERAVASAQPSASAIAA